MNFLRRLSPFSFAAAALLIIGMCHPPMAYFRPMKIAVCTFGIVAACLFWRRVGDFPPPMPPRLTLSKSRLKI